MSTYIRGPRCGTDNCPSRLWRIIDGRRTCQYGHVMDGDVEFNDEDEIATGGSVVTRRLNLTTNATGTFTSSYNASQVKNSRNEHKSRLLYGYEAYILYIKSFQVILKAQCRWLISNMGFPESFEDVVKVIWAKYLTYISTIKKKNAQNDEVEWDNDRDCAIETGKHRPVTLRINAAIAILYIAATHMGIPVYMCDFVRWITTTKILYFRAHDVLPVQWRQSLPSFYIANLEGVHPPSNAQLYGVTAAICGWTRFPSDFECKVNIEGLILKLVIRFALPSEFYLYVVKHVEELDVEENFMLMEQNRSEIERFHQIAELRLIAHFILVVRWIFMCTTNDGYPTSLIRSLVLNNISPSSDNRSAFTMEDRISKASRFADEMDWFNMGDKETEDYLQWVEEKFLKTQENLTKEMSIDHRIARRRLYELIPTDIERLEDTNVQLKTASTKPVSLVDELQEKLLNLSNDAGQQYPLDGQDENLRLSAIVSFENTMIETLAKECAVTLDQLQVAITRVQRFCIKQAKARSTPK